MLEDSATFDLSHPFNRESDRVHVQSHFTKHVASENVFMLFAVPAEYKILSLVPRAQNPLKDGQVS
jgi:hypothetical protein